MKVGKILLYILAGFGAFIALIVAFAFLGSSGVDKAAEAVMAEFKAGNIQSVYDNSAMTEEFTFEEFEAAMMVGTEWDITKAEKLGWTGRGFENSEKYIYGNFRFPNNEEQMITFWFIENEAEELVLLGITGGTPEDYEE